MQLSTVFNPVMINFLHFSYNIRRPPRWSTQIVIRLDWRWMEKRETSRQLRGRLQPNARNTQPPNIPLLRFKTQRNSRKCIREAKALRGRPRLQGKRRKVCFLLYFGLLILRSSGYSAQNGNIKDVKDMVKKRKKYDIQCGAKISFNQFSKQIFQK